MTAKVLVYPATLKMLRSHKGWSQEELAKKARVVPSTVKRIESPNKVNAYRCRSDVAHKLASALGVSVGTLGEYDDDIISLKAAQLDLLLENWDREAFMEASLMLADLMDRREAILRRSGLSRT